MTIDEGLMLYFVEIAFATDMIRRSAEEGVFFSPISAKFLF